MTKKETIWRYILHKALTERVLTFTQKSIAKEFRISTSTVFNALTVPRKIGAIEVRGRFFRLRDFEKLLLIWATARNFKSDISYSTFVPSEVREIEGRMPPDVIFGAFSAYRFAYHEEPSDYSAVYVYADDVEEIRRRFPKQKGSPNLFVLKPDSQLASFGKTTPDVQTFADLWNISEWYTKDYLNALKKRMNIFA